MANLFIVFHLLSVKDFEPAVQGSAHPRDDCRVANGRDFCGSPCLHVIRRLRQHIRKKFHLTATPDEARLVIANIGAAAAARVHRRCSLQRFHLADDESLHCTFTSFRGQQALLSTTNEPIGRNGWKSGKAGVADGPAQICGRGSGQKRGSPVTGRMARNRKFREAYLGTERSLEGAFASSERNIFRQQLSARSAPCPRADLGRRVAVRS